MDHRFPHLDSDGWDRNKNERFYNMKYTSNFRVDSKNKIKCTTFKWHGIILCICWHLTYQEIAIPVHCRVILPVILQFGHEFLFL